MLPGTRLFMTLSRPLLLRLLLTLLLTLLGAGLCALLLPAEMRSINEQLTGFPDSDAATHHARLWILGALCMLPALAMAGYSIGGTLDRYLARQFGAIFFICFSALFTIWLLIDLTDNLSDLRSSPDPSGTALFFYTTRAPAVVVLLVPYALLLSLIYALGKLSHDREMVAMVQSGRSVVRVAMPLIGAGLWCNLLCLGMNYHWAPTAEGRKSEILDRARGILVTEAKHVLYFNADQRRLWMVGAFPEHYERGEPLLGVEITNTLPGGGVASRLTARSAHWERGTGTWTFERPVVCTYQKGEPPVFDTRDEPLIAKGWPETPWQLIKPGLAASYLGIPDLTGWLRANALKPVRSPQKNAAAPYLTQWHYRWALPFACLVTVLLAAPLSIHFARRGPGGNVFLAIILSVLMLLSNSLVLSFGEAGMMHPAAAAWATNTAFALLGIYLFRCRITGRPPHQSLLRLFKTKS
jgi:lipopolysaccharide export system permease protein